MTKRSQKSIAQRLFGPVVLLLLCNSPSAFSQTLLLKGATVHTVIGKTFAPGQVLIRAGKIASVGETVEAAGAVSIDLTGQHLYPGLIALNTVLGLTEIEAVRATQDTTEVGEFTPEVESWIAVNPDSELIPVTRANGIAYFEPVPAGGLVAGQSALLAMAGWTAEEMTVKKPVGLHVLWPSMNLQFTPPEPRRGKSKTKSVQEQAKERRNKVQSITEFFEDAKAYARAKEAPGKTNASSTIERVPAWEAMLPYVTGRLPVVIHADEVRQIRSALEWAGTNDLQVILAGGRDAWMVAEALGARKIPVLYSHVFTQPARDTEAYDVHYSAPEVLRKAGVRVIFTIGPSSFDATLTRNLPYAAAQAIAFGFPAEEALKSVTLYPAQVARVEDRLGSIETGKEATLFSIEGDLFDIRTNVKHMWIAGKKVSLENRQTRLYEKYRSRPRP